MKRMPILRYFTLFLSTLFVIFLISAGQWLYAILFLLIVAMNQYQLNMQRQKIAKSLILLSNKIDAIHSRKKISLSFPTEDSIFSKLDNQIFQLANLVEYTEGTVKQEQQHLKQQIAEISHQLRTPLANLHFYLELALNNSLSQKEQTDYLVLAQESRDDITFLIEGFILSSRLETDLIQINKQSIPIKEFLASIITRTFQAAQQKKIRIHVIDSPTLQCSVCADFEWLQEAVTNVLENSIKYSPHYSTITIAVTGNDLFTKISIRDQGIGIESGNENLLLQRYYRGKNASHIPGHGLGLYITNEIVKKHDGFIKIKSKDVGLSVTLYLPSAY